MMMQTAHLTSCLKLHTACTVPGRPPQCAHRCRPSLAAQGCRTSLCNSLALHTLPPALGLKKTIGTSPFSQHSQIWGSTQELAQDMRALVDLEVTERSERVGQRTIPSSCVILAGMDGEAIFVTGRGGAGKGSKSAGWEGNILRVLIEIICCSKGNLNLHCIK